MRVFDFDLYAHRVIRHLTDLTFADNVHFLYHLERGLPIPDVRGKLVALGSHVVQCEAHSAIVRQGVSLSHNTTEILSAFAKSIGSVYNSVSDEVRSPIQDRG